MKHGLCLAASGILFALSLIQSASTAPTGLPANEVRRGLAISPVTLNLRGKNRTLVGWGSYIVNAQGGCNDCHTSPSYDPDGNPFEGEPEQINTANYLAGGQQFGPFTSRNITPDKSGKPAGMTLAQFKNTLRTGVNPGGDHLQVMPWPVYGKMTDRDLNAVYEFLRSIPHAEPPAANK